MELVIERYKRLVKKPYRPELTEHAVRKAGKLLLSGKSIILSGPKNTGKSTLLQALYKAHRAMQEENDISTYVDTSSCLYGKEEGLYKDITEGRVDSSTITHLWLDDLGTMQARMKFGNKFTPIRDWLHDAYEKQEDTWFCITTNLNREQLAERLGSRVQRKLLEMAETIVMNQPTK